MNRLAIAPLLLALALALAAAPAHAEEPEPPEPRPVPDYDGRGDDPTTAGDVALWVPRILLSPLYLVSEFVVRRPLGWLVTALEREKIPETLLELFQFGPHNEIAIAPTALIDLGFEPSVGIYARWNDFLNPGNKLRLHTATWGRDWIRLTLADRYEWDREHNRVQLRGEYTRRPDGLYYGTGLDNSEQNFSRYRYELLETVLSFDSEFWRASSFRSAARLTHMEFGSDGTCCDGAPVGERVEAGTLLDRFGEPLGLPPGFEGYTIYAHGMRFILDTREERPHQGGGFRIGVDVEYAFDVQDPLGRRWLRTGAATGVFIDLTGENRVLHLGAIAVMVSPIEGELPFTEMPDLGDVGPLKGFIDGWVIGESVAAAMLEYEWPIWVWLDGMAHLSIGNAFGRHFDGFDVEDGRLSTGVGIRTVDERDHAFTLLVGFGTETLRDGADLDTVRLVFGATRVF